MLSKNPMAIQFLEQNRPIIHCSYLVANPNPEAMELLKEKRKRTLNQICWFTLSSNPAAIKLLTQNQDKIDWSQLS
jgi:hypothetical protein